MDHVRRRVGDRRQPVSQLGAHLGLDGVDQPRHDVVEDADLILGIAVGAVDEEVGNAGQNVDAAIDIAGGESGLELVKKRKGTHRNSGRRHAIELSITMH